LTFEQRPLVNKGLYFWIQMVVVVHRFDSSFSSFVLTLKNVLFCPNQAKQRKWPIWCSHPLWLLVARLCMPPKESFSNPVLALKCRFPSLECNKIKEQITGHNPAIFNHMEENMNKNTVCNESLLYTNRHSDKCFYNRERE